MKVKELSYSYPTSPNAEKLGLGKLGCWIIEVDRKVYAVLPTKEKAAMLNIWNGIKAEISAGSFTPTEHPHIFDPSIP